MTAKMKRGTYTSPDSTDITPDDATTYDPSFRMVYVGTGGNLTVRTVAGNTRTFTNVQDGTFVPIQVDQIHATGTTASNIEGML